MTNHDEQQETRTVNGIDGTQLKTVVERVERIEEDIKGLQDDRAAVYAEAKANGFDTSILKKIIRMRRRDKHDLDEEELLIDIYKRALGMEADADE